MRVAILTISDSVSRGTHKDTSGANLRERCAQLGWNVVSEAVLPDEPAEIRELLIQLSDSSAADLILTTGGTGPAPRDVTPEAVEPLLDKRIEGFSVIFHLVSYQTVGLSTLQSRALAGIIDGVFIFCLPGSNGAVRDG